MYYTLGNMDLSVKAIDGPSKLTTTSYPGASKYLRFLPTPHSVCCSWDTLCCSQLDFGHCRSFCERGIDIKNCFQLVLGVTTPPTSPPFWILQQSCCETCESSLCRFCAPTTAKWVLSVIYLCSRALLVSVEALYNPWKLLASCDRQTSTSSTLFVHVALCARQLQPCRMFRTGLWSLWKPLWAYY